MEHNEHSEVFSYSYSAKEQEEVQSIRQKYIPKEESKLEQLRRLDNSVTKRGTQLAITLGVISCLIMGGGMSCVLEGDAALFIPGILIGILGLIGMALAYPLYVKITKKERERMAPEILRLTDELMR